jgi:undecaprenyl-diphosphatase
MRRRTQVLAALGVLALVGALQAVAGVSAWADRVTVGATYVAFALLLAVTIDALGVLAAPRVGRWLGASTARIERALASSARIRATAARFPRASRWLLARVSTDRASGLYLTVTFVVGGYLLVSFIDFARELLVGIALTRLDPRITTLLRSFRSPALTRVMWSASLLFDPLVAATLVAATAAVLWAWGRRPGAVLLASSVATSALVRSVVARILSRPRPPAHFALINLPHSFSFPSGHTLMATTYLATLTFLGWRAARSPRARLAIVTGATLLGGLVGISRVYLGAHWMSDVVASWTLGLAWATFACGAYAIRARYRPMADKTPDTPAAAVRLATVAVAALLVVGALVVDAHLSPVRFVPAGSATTSEWVVTRTNGLVTPTAGEAHVLPRFSENLDGTRMEPISLIFVGTRHDLVRGFKTAGWSVAEKPSASSIVRLAWSAVLNRPYPTAPVTPTFLSGSVQDLAFEKPEGAATARRRHHNRFWMTGLRVNGVPVWVATASLDTGLELGKTIPLPTHHIDPNIDAEMLYVADDLAKTGLVAPTETVRVTRPSRGTDAQGDPWYTRGLAVVLQAR